MENAQSINGIKDKARESMSDVRGALNEAGRDMGTAAKKVVDEITHVGKEAIKNYSEEGKKQLATVEDLIRQYPVRSVCLGLVGGVLLSRILR